MYWEPRSATKYPLHDMQVVHSPLPLASRLTCRNHCAVVENVDLSGQSTPFPSKPFPDFVLKILHYSACAPPDPSPAWHGASCPPRGRGQDESTDQEALWPTWGWISTQRAPRPAPDAPLKMLKDTLLQITATGARLGLGDLVSPCQ